MSRSGPTGSPFMALPAKIDLGDMDRRIIKWWQGNNVFARSLDRTAGGPPWVFYEGPPTANGAPGTHHIEARVFKDVFPRYRTMRGYSVPRRAGWDCHGLPVELAVEKELGLSGKREIEKIGIAEFNDRCRESVLRHVDEFAQLTERRGYWIDLSHAYETMSPEYVDSLWWSLQRIHADGRLVEDFRVAPYCTRDGTTLSDHEVAQGYETVTDPSVYVRFPLCEPLAGQADVDLLVWTTTPWTLVANTAVAVHPQATYVLARTERGTFVVAEPLIGKVLGDGAEVLASMPGTELAGRRYRRPFDLVEIPDAHLVLLAEYVTTDEGTGLVHQAPAFGADDLAICRANDLPLVNPIGPNGRFLDEVPLVGGVFFKDADAILVDELKRSGLLFRYQRFDTARADRLLADFIDDLSNWYVRRSRQRFWAGEADALATLYACLDILTRLLAPIMPFVTEEVWQQVIRPGDEDAPESVHLAAWPQSDAGLIDPELSAQVATARALAEAGRSARKAGNVRIRQPLSRALVGIPVAIALPQTLLDDVSDELNVKLLQPLDADSEVMDVRVKPNFAELGKRFAKRTQQVARAILAANPTVLVGEIRQSGTFRLPVDGEEITIGASDVLITEVPRIGWLVESQRGVTIALDMQLTPALEAEGVARDVIRVVQQARREAEFDVSDRIAMSIAAAPPILAGIREHQEFIARETLATSVALVDVLSEGFTGMVGDGSEITVRVVKA